VKFSILHTEWSSGWGGQEQRIILECVKVRQLGHDVVIACQPESGILARARDHAIPTEEVKIRGSFDLRAIRDIACLIRKHRITVVNTHSGKDSWVGGFAAKLAKADLLVRTRHLAIPISTNPLNFIHKMFDGFVTTGEAVRMALITKNRIPAEKVVSIPTGVSLEQFDPRLDPGELKKELGIPSDNRVVTIVAILRKVKRHDLFLEAAAILKGRFPTLTFLVVGEGPMRESIEAKIDELGLAHEVILTGHRNDIPQILAISDVVALTSDKEGVPQALTQAMAMECPVVAAPVGGIPDLILEGKTGLFADVGNAGSFADKISILLQDSAMRTELGHAAKRHVLQNFTDEIMATKTINFYNYLLQLKTDEGTLK